MPLRRRGLLLHWFLARLAEKRPSSPGFVTIVTAHCSTLDEYEAKEGHSDDYRHR